MQEMSLKIDQGFINSMLGLFISEEEGEEARQERFKQDMKSIETVLKDFAMQSSADEQKHFYDMLHISPLKVSDLCILLYFHLPSLLAGCNITLCR